MSLRLTALAAAALSCSWADTLTLRSGRVIRGQYLGGDARHIRMAVGDRVDTFSVEDAGDLQFGGEARQGAADPAPPVLDRNDQTPPPPVAVAGIQIPSGTAIAVRIIDRVDSNVARLGQTFRASVDEPVEIDGQTVIPRGADALVKLVEDRQSGKFEGKTVLTLALVDLAINGQTVETATCFVSEARGARTAGGVSGQQVKIPSETRLSFTLQQPIRF